jgi:hypothetical protein
MEMSEAQKQNLRSFAMMFGAALLAIFVAQRLA